MAGANSQCNVDWDERYSRTPEKWLTPDPEFVAAYREFVAPGPAAPGRALDLAGGMGRHALYLAERGWDVTLIDASGVALANARQLADKRGLLLKTEQCDLSAGHRLPPGQFDLIAVYYFLERALFPQISAALKPNGFLLYATYTMEQLKFGKGPSDPKHLLQSGELASSFPQLKTLRYREIVSGKAFAELIARREEHDAFQHSPLASR